MNTSLSRISGSCQRPTRPRLAPILPIAFLVAGILGALPVSAQAQTTTPWTGTVTVHQVDHTSDATADVRIQTDVIYTIGGPDLEPSDFVWTQQVTWSATWTLDYNFYQCPAGSLLESDHQVFVDHGSGTALFAVYFPPYGGLTNQYILNVVADVGAFDIVHQFCGGPVDFVVNVPQVDPGFPLLPADPTHLTGDTVAIPPNDSRFTTTASWDLTSAATGIGVADLALSKDSSDPVLVGDTLEYLLNVTNNGPAGASGVSLTDTLPSTVSFVGSGGDASCTETSGVVTCNLGSLASGAGASISILVTPTQPGTILNVAQVSADQSDPNLSNNSAQASTTVTPAVDLYITKTDSPDPVVAHQQLTYLISVSNLAPSVDATGVMVTDRLAAHLTFGSATPSQGTCHTSKTKGATTVICDLGTIANGFSATITLVVKPLQPGTVTNTASVTSSVIDRLGVNNTAQQVTTVLK